MPEPSIRPATDAFAAAVLPIVRQIEVTGTTASRTIATALNARGIRTTRVGAWHEATVRNLMARQRFIPACAGNAKTHCPGRSIPMAALDGMVLEHLDDRLFTPARLRVILSAYLAQSAEADTARREKLGQARRALTEAQGRLGRLLDLVEQGLMDLDDPSLKERLDAAKLVRRAAGERVKPLEAAQGSGGRAVTDDGIDRLARALHQALHSDDPTFRKAYLRLFVGEIVVDHTEVRMQGPTAPLARAAASGELLPAGNLVPSFVREWRAGCDKNENWVLTVNL